MAGEVLGGEVAAAGSVCPLGGICLGSNCEGPQTAAGLFREERGEPVVVGVDSIHVGNVRPEEWCGQEQVPRPVYDARLLRSFAAIMGRIA